MSTQQNHLNVLDAFRAHASGTRTDTKSVTLNTLRNAYPGYHVTEVNANSCALFQFAEAGKAEVRFGGDNGDKNECMECHAGTNKEGGVEERENAEEEGRVEEEVGNKLEEFLGGEFEATRSWSSVGTGVEKKMHPGKLEDSHRFVHFQYIWGNKTYIVYYMAYRIPFQNACRLFYILHPHPPSPSTTAQKPRHSPQTDALILTCSKWTSSLHSEIWVFDNGIWDKSHSLWSSISTAEWDDVILDPAMKDNLISDVQGFFDSRDIYATYAVPWKRGIILHGVPGNGKTVSIKALINSLSKREDQVSSLYVKGFETKCETQQHSIRQIFLQARECAPCLLIFEDLDSLVGDNIRSYFLNEVDGLESNDGILMIGSTNHLDRLDPAIAKRPSRFDRKYHFKLPGAGERKLYAEYWRKKLLAKNEELEFPEEMCGIIADMTEGFSFAYLKELFVMALLGLVRASFKGDDFEIVDEDEAASAPEEEGEEEKKKTTQEKEKDQNDKKEPEPEQNICTCASKCHTCGKPLPSASTSPSNPLSSSPSAIESPSPPSTLPNPTIPSHLNDNTLLKVIKRQIRILHAEMDNTNSEEWPSGKKQVSGTGRGGRLLALTQRRLAARLG